MSRWSVWQIGRGGAPERVGTYASGADARRVLRSAIPRGAAVDPDGEVNEARGISPAHVTAIEAAADEWLCAAAVVSAPTQDVVEITEPLGIIREEAVEPDAPAVGIGATTESPLPVSFEPPVVEPAPLSFAERAADLRAEIARGIPSADIEHLRVQLADANARAVAAEEATAQMQAVLDGVRATTAALDTRAERAEAERDALAASLRERSEQLDTARRTIAALRAELAAVSTHPVVRINAPTRRRPAPCVETAVETLMRRLDERARGIR